MKILNRRLLQNEAALDTAFDNYQEFNSRKYQQDGGSADSMHATCRLSKRSLPVVPTVGSVIIGDTNKYLVIRILYKHIYASLLRVRSLQYCSNHPLPWPSIGWRIDTLHNADCGSKQIDYRLCYVPRSLHIKRVVYKTTTHMIFSDLTLLNMTIVKPSNIIPCVSSDYVRILSRSRTVTAIHKTLVCPHIRNTKNSDNVNMIDIMNAESIKYCDQTNSDDVQFLFNENK